MLLALLFHSLPLHSLLLLPLLASGVVAPLGFPVAAFVESAAALLAAWIAGLVEIAVVLFPAHAAAHVAALVAISVVLVVAIAVQFAATAFRGQSRCFPDIREFVSSSCSRRSSLSSSSCWCDPSRLCQLFRVGPARARHPSLYLAAEPPSVMRMCSGTNLAHWLQAHWLPVRCLLEYWLLDDWLPVRLLLVRLLLGDWLLVRCHRIRIQMRRLHCTTTSQLSQSSALRATYSAISGIIISTAKLR